MKFRLEHETVTFEYKIDNLTLMHTLSLLNDYVQSGYQDLTQGWRVMAQGAARAFLAFLAMHGRNVEFPKGSDPVTALLTELPLLANETGVFKDAVLTFRVSETNDSPTITDIQLQL